MTSLTVGIIGAGRIGKLHVDNLKKITQIRIKSVSDVFIDHLESWAKEKQIEVLTTDYHELLNDPEIQAVFICSPTNTHATIIKEAALAGKDIFCEKPVSFSVEETEEALAVVKKKRFNISISITTRQ